MRHLAFAWALFGATALMAPGRVAAQNDNTPPATGLLGEAAGMRSALASHGVTVLLSDAEEVFANTAGGLKRGATYEAASTLTVQVESDKAFGWAGGQFNVSALQLRGRSLSQYYLGDLQTVSGIAATPTTRLWEAWYQQQIAAGQLDIRVGLQSLDQEFMVSQGAAVFLNTAMGWPMLPTADLFAGGPAYPLASLGARMRAQMGPFTLLAGAFQDNPPGGPLASDGQLRGASRWGGNFNLRTGALLVLEAQYAPNQPDPMAPEAVHTPHGLPATYKLGMWFDSARYPDARYDRAGLSLANPLSSGQPRWDAGNLSLYAVADQTIWQAAEGPMALAVFVRPVLAPSDRNQIDLSVNGGVTLKAPLPGRDEDTLGLGFGVARVSSAVLGLAQDTGSFGGAWVPRRGAESFAELTYQAQVAPWWQVQPDVQYRWLPGGGTVNPSQPSKRLSNEFILGLRSTITF